MHRGLERSILKTLSYFDTFDFPLTKEELFRWLWEPPQTSYQAFLTTLDSLIAQEQISLWRGFCILPGQEKSVDTRQAAIALVKQKMKKARRAAWLMQQVPNVSAIFVCNTVASSIPTPESDIDVFIVVKEKKLWLTRLCITVLLSIFGLRRTKTRIADRICLSFYITDEHLDLYTIMRKPHDIYLAYWMDQLVSLYDPTGLAQKLYEQNSWVQQYLPHTTCEEKKHRLIQVSSTPFFLFLVKKLEQLLNTPFGRWCEKKAQQLQQKKMKKNNTSVALFPDTRVVVNEYMLKFHENDRREFFATRWKDRCWKEKVI